MARKRSQTRAQKLASLLQSQIEEGTLRSGQRLIELRIAEKYDYSQNTVRDALAILEQKGWVVKRARHGVYVRSFGLEDALEVSDLVFALQDIAYRSAVRDLTPQAMERMRACIRQARTSIECGDILAADDAFFQFYHILVHSLAQPLTAQLLDQVIVRARILARVARDNMQHDLEMPMKQVVAHEAILDLLDKGNIQDVLDIIKFVTSSFREIVQQTFCLEPKPDYTSAAIDA
ncbi:MAG: GntR family transcriptional regulator [Chloroflexota bacterium]|nr:GntR family transcriptional regulator [Chloroflexota bacterium]